MPGKITVSGATCANSFTFRGRIGGKRLAPGSYRLTATPQANRQAGTSQTNTFKIAADRCTPCSPHERTIWSLIRCSSSNPRLLPSTPHDAPGRRRCSARSERAADRAYRALRQDRGLPSAADGLPDGLTPREAQVLTLIADGLTNARIAEYLVVSPATVSSHFNHLFARAGIRDRAQAVRYAYSHGLARPPE